MKIQVIILTAALFAASCNTADKKTETPGEASNVPALSEGDKTKMLADTANYTTIEWLDPNPMNMGKVKDGATVEVTFRFRNAGSKPLAFTSVTAGCGCTVPEEPKGLIAPGEEGTIKAKFDSKGRKGTNTKEIFVVANTNPTSQSRTFVVEVE